MCCMVLMGANIASKVVKEEFCETTIGACSDEHGHYFAQLFNTPYFRVTVVSDCTSVEASVEICGALRPPFVGNMFFISRPHLF